MDSIAVIMPAYNVAKVIERVIKGVCTHIPLENIIVVNDGSNDESRERTRSSGAVLLEHAENQGKGAALKTGFAWCLDRQYDAVITMDSDGQHHFQEIPRFIQAFKEKALDIVIGSRMHDKKNMPWQRIITNTLSSRILSWLTGQPILDSQSGFRLIARRVLQALTLTSQRYDIESELLIKAAASGFTIGSIPITTIYSREKSHFKPIRDTWYIFRSIGRGFKLRRQPAGTQA